MNQAHEHVTVLLDRAAAGDPRASEELLPLVYEELRRLAESQMVREAPGHTLQPTALVHEAYMRLVGTREVKWDGRGHFFGAAAQAMRRVLIERARRHKSEKRGGGAAKHELNEHVIQVPDLGATPGGTVVDLIALDDALSRLEQEEPLHAQIVMLRFFAGLTVEQTAGALSLSEATIKKEWAYARAWLRREMENGHRAGG